MVRQARHASKLANPLGSVGSGSYWYAPWDAGPYQSTGSNRKAAAKQKMR